MGDYERLCLHRLLHGIRACISLRYGSAQTSPSPPALYTMALLALPVTAFIGAVLVLIPLPSHWRARNYATISLVAWLFVVNLIYGINSTIWNDNIGIRLLVWCDISASHVNFQRPTLTRKISLQLPN